MSDKLSSTDRAMIEAVVGSTEDQLLESLGEMLGGGAVRDTDPQGARARAEAWLRRNHERLRDAVCGRFNEHAFQDSVADIAAIADVLAASFNKPTAFTVAAILLKRGLQTFCA